MTVNRTMITPLMRLGLRSDFRDTYKGFEKEYPMFLNVGNMEGNEIVATTTSGLPRQVELGELEPFTFIDPTFGEVVRYTDTIWGLGFAISKEAKGADRYGKASQSSKWLGKSTAVTQEFEAADLLNDAFTGTVFTGMNGEPLISATHSNLGTNDTWSNLITGNPQLSTLGLQAMFETAERTTDQNGNPVVVRPNRLIIGVGDQWMADQLINNPDEPFTANRNINTLRKKNLSTFVSHYMTTTGRRWFGIDTSLNDAHFDFKEKPSYPDWYDEMTRAHYFASYQRFAVYFYDPRGWVGSNAT